MIIGYIKESNTMLLHSKEDIKEKQEILKLVTVKDIVQYIVNRDDLINYDSDRKANYLNQSAFECFTIKEYSAFQIQDNILFFYALTKYDMEQAHYFKNEVFRFIETILKNCNNQQGIADSKPLYVSIEVFGYDRYDEKYLEVATFSRCYNVSKIQARRKIVGTKDGGVSNLDAVLNLMRTSGAVLQLNNCNYVLQDFPYNKTIRLISENDMHLRFPLGFVAQSKREVSLVVSKPITEKRYYSLESLQEKIDSMISSNRHYLGWNSAKNCFILLCEG